MTKPKNSGKVLVTGGTGFVGSHLADQLVERGYKVKCLARQQSNLQYLKHPDIEIVHGGLDNATDWDTALEGVDTIYHAAGLTHARRKKDYFEVNHHGTEIIIGAALKWRKQIRRFIYISSLAAVGPGASGQPVNEDTKPAPINAYGRSKLMGEETARAVADLLSVTIVRPPAVYGPRDTALHQLFKSVSRGIAPTIGNYEKHVSLVHVRDLVEGIILAGESKASTGRAYFISSEQVYSTSSIFELLTKIFNRKVRTIAMPRSLAYLGAIAVEVMAGLTGKAPVTSRDRVKALSQPYWGCSIDRARNELGYREQVSLEEGMRETIDWYRREGWL
jgi:nucleoside-diphosphate-sugar epimerase